jgi:hypothetical protein
MLLFGMLHIVDMWPFSCFPTFDGPTTDTVTQLSVQVVDAGKAAQDWNLSSDLRMRALYRRWYWLALQGTSPGSAARPKVAALLNLWFKVHPEVQARNIVVFLDTYQMRPLEGNRVRVARQKGWEFAF